MDIGIHSTENPTGKSEHVTYRPVVVEMSQLVSASENNRTYYINIQYYEILYVLSRVNSIQCLRKLNTHSWIRLKNLLVINYADEKYNIIKYFYFSNFIFYLNTEM